MTLTSYNNTDFMEFNQRNNPTPSVEPLSNKWRSIFSNVGIFLLAPVLAILLTSFVIQSYQVDGESMETTLQNRDRLLVDKFPRTVARITHHQYVPQRGNIVIFNQAGLPGYVGEKQLIKRVIGLPGEHVVIKDGIITIYNNAHPQGFNPDESGLYHIDTPGTLGNVDLTLQSDEIFVCGDNRNNSEDSRFFGPVKLNNVVGKLSVRILPISNTKHF
jgi:signal peptidase I